MTIRVQDLRLDVFPDDKYRDNWEILQEVIDVTVNVDNPFINFEGRIFVVEGTGTAEFQINHDLGFVPTDIIYTFNSNEAAITKGTFTTTVVNLTASVDTDLRVILGRFN